MRAWEITGDAGVWYGLLADVVVLVHLVFVVFALLGGCLTLWRRKLVWVHLPAAAWAVVVEWAGWPCPLTPLELWLRARSGGEGYVEGFLAHYLVPLLYPADLTREIQFGLGVAVVLCNVAIYWMVFRRFLKRGAHSGRCGGKGR